MKGKTRLRQRGKQPKPYWRWQPHQGDKQNRGRWMHPGTLKKLAGIAGLVAAFLAPGLSLAIGKEVLGVFKDAFTHTFPGFLPGLKEMTSEALHNFTNWFDS